MKIWTITVIIKNKRCLDAGAQKFKSKIDTKNIHGNCDKDYILLW
jgi:hypothetical protein